MLNVISPKVTDYWQHFYYLYNINGITFDTINFL